MEDWWRRQGDRGGNVMSGTSPSRRQLCTTPFNVAVGTRRPPRVTPAIGVMLLGTAVLSIAAAVAAEAEPPMPPLPPFASEPPVGVVLEMSTIDERAIEEPEAAADIQLVTSEQLLVQADADGKAEDDLPSQSQQDQQLARRDQKDKQDQKDEQELKDKQEQKDKDSAAKACGEQSQACKEALRTLRDDGIETIALDIRVSGRPGNDYPCECRLEGETFQPRRFATTMMTWKAAGNCHKPLYFEDWNLERYGHSHGPLDPIFSAAHFFVTLPVLPYKMGVELPWECVYPLGYYRPGNCAPWTVPAVPISCRGFAVEAATVTGLVFLLP